MYVATSGTDFLQNAAYENPFIRAVGAQANAVDAARIVQGSHTGFAQLTGDCGTNFDHVRETRCGPVVADVPTLLAHHRFVGARAQRREIPIVLRGSGLAFRRFEGRFDKEQKRLAVGAVIATGAQLLG